MRDTILNDISNQAAYRASNESFSDMFSGVRGMLQSMFGKAQSAAEIKPVDPSLFNNAEDDEISEPLIPMQASSKGTTPFNIPYDFVKALGRYTYTDFKTLQVFVPEGMLVPYLEHGDVLMQSMDYLDDVEKHFIDPFITWLAQRVGNPSLLSSTVPSCSDKPAKLPQMDQLEDRYHSQFATSGQRKGLMDYTAAVTRQADWSVVCTQLRALTERCTDKRHQAMLDKLKRIDEMFKTLEVRIEQNAEGYKVSKETLVTMVECSYAAAKIFEYYGLTRFRVDSYRMAVSRSLNKIDYVLSRQAA